MTKKKNPAKLHRSGNWGVIEMADVCYTFEIAGQFNIASNGVLPLNQGTWQSQPLKIGNFKIIPNGFTNQLPIEIRDILEDNNLAEGVFKRQRGLLWGQGPALYTEQWVANQKVRTWLDDAEVQSWLDGFDYQEMLRRAIVDYNHMEGHFTKIFLNRGSMIGQRPVIARLENVGYHRSRLEWPEDGLNSRNIITGDWFNPNLLGLKSYPIFNSLRPFSQSMSMMFCNMASFARDFYGLPAYYGALNWIKRGSAIPKILDSLTKNTQNIKYHNQSPASYWEAKKEYLLQSCSTKNILYKDKMLEDLKDETFKQLGEVLSGEQNVGKFFTSETILNDKDIPEGWKIEAIDMKVKDFIDSQLNIAKQADSAIVGGLGLHPSLANVMVEGKLASGSEMIYSLKLHLATETEIPESIICKPINMALAVNWPGKKVKLGFYHSVVKTEDNVPPPTRIKNAI